MSHARNTHFGSALEAVDTTIDYSKPMFWQVYKVGAVYDTWVHKPSMQKSFRMFQNDFLETFSMAPWYAIPSFWLPVLYICTTLAMQQDGPQFVADAQCSDRDNCTEDSMAIKITSTSNLTVTSYLMWFAVGTFVWTLFEYLTHRWVFHAKISMDSPLLITAHFVLHGQHHKFPMDKNRLVFPIVPGCIVSSMVYYGIVAAIFPYKASLAVMSGFLLGYICYDMVHYMSHFGGQRIRFIKEIQRSHMAHHFKDQGSGYGISSVFWDRIFNTSNRHKI